MGTQHQPWGLNGGDNICDLYSNPNDTIASIRYVKEFPRSISSGTGKTRCGDEYERTGIKVCSSSTYPPPNYHEVNANVGA